MTDNDISKHCMLSERYLRDIHIRTDCMNVSHIKSLNTLHNDIVISLTQAGI